MIFHLDYSEKACQDHTTLVIFNSSLNPNLYGGGGKANLPPRQFFATAQKRLELDC